MKYPHKRINISKDIHKIIYEYITNYGIELGGIEYATYEIVKIISNNYRRRNKNKERKTVL